MLCGCSHKSGVMPLAPYVAYVLQEVVQVDVSYDPVINRHDRN